MSSSNNTPVVITGHKDGSIRGYSLKGDGKAVFHKKDLFDDAVTSLCLSGDNNMLLCTSKEGFVVKMFDLRKHEVVKDYSHDAYMNSYDHNKMCFGPDERYVIAGGGNIIIFLCLADGSIFSWVKDSGKFH
jgi:WD40 repeat protein